MANKTSQRKKIKLTPAVIALITALIGCLGTIIAASIGYMGIRAQIGIPISATQTAQATNPPEAIDNFSALNGKLTAQLWLEPVFGCISGPSKIIPENIDTDTSQAQIQIGEAIQSMAYNQWSIGPHASIPIILKNTTSDNNWIRLNNTIKATINLLSTTAPEKANVITGFGGCGGGQLKYFPEIELATSFDEYVQNSTYTEFDYFTLQPGEEELFIVSFKCASTGVYKFNIEISGTFNNEEGVLIISDTPPVVCPASYDSWFVEGSTFYMDKSYFWDGSDYSIK